MPSRKRKHTGSPCKENETVLNGVSKVKNPKGRSDKSKRSVGPRGQSQSCHQCRQSIHSSKGVGEVKLGQKRIKCSTCTRYWCENCLRNRYGLERSSLEGVSWFCPVCKKTCNCSLCRKKNGKLATGILTPLAKNAGFSNVSEFLEKGTDDIAKCLQWTSPLAPDEKPKKKKKRPDPKSPSIKKGSSDSQTNSAQTSNRKQFKDKKHSTTAEDENNDREDFGDLLSHPEYVITTTEEGSDLQSVDTSKVQNTTFHFPRRSLRNQRNRTVKYFPEEEEVEADCSDSKTKRVAKKRRKKAKRPRLDEYDTSETESDQSLTNDLHSSNDETFTEKMLELERSRTKALRDLREREVESKLASREEKRKARLESFREKRELLLKHKSEKKEAKEREKQRLKEEKRKAKELKIESKRMLQERLQRAKQLVKDAQRDKLLRRKKVKERYQLEFQELIRISKGERPGQTREGPQNFDNHLEEIEDHSFHCCEEGGTVSFPSLPLFKSDIPGHHYTSRLVVVTEFIHNFSDFLNIEHKVDKVSLTSMLQNDRVMKKLYSSLLGVIAEGNDELSSKLKKVTRRPGSLEGLVCEYLHQSGRNVCGLHQTWDQLHQDGISVGGECGELTMDQRLIVLDHLCHSVMQTAMFSNEIENRTEKFEQKRREVRLKESQLTKSMREEIKSLCDSEGTNEELAAKKDEFITQLKELHSHHLVGNSQPDIRGWCLGTDRHDRVYWRLHGFSGIMVESPSDEVWRIIDSRELLEQVIQSLNSTGVREGHLYDNLKTLEESFMN